MATADSISELSPPSPPPVTDLLVMVAAMQPQHFETLLTHLTGVFPTEGLLIAAEGAMPVQREGLRVVPVPPGPSVWTLTAADFLRVAQLAEEHQARAILILGPGADSLGAGALRLLANGALTGTLDLSMPRYTLPPHAGMINSAILYPLTRALFAQRIRYPLAVDMGLSLRMAQRLAAVSQKFAQPDDPDALLWPASEAAVAGYSIDQFDVGSRALPQPVEVDVNAILARITGSLFADIEKKAAYWQRARRMALPRRIAEQPGADGTADVPRMVESFRFAYNNLLEIWSLVLPPHSLLGLKRLSQMSAVEFRLPDDLWARIVYDFVVAYRLRTINRGHLLGAFIPLYLGWVAGHINLTAAGTGAESHIEAVAAAFEADKSYVVSRWRWPDRFNA